MKTGQVTRTTVLLAAFLAILPALLAANITNEGNDAVQIEIERESGFSRYSTLYPGQSESLPSDATSVRVVSRSFARGDEVIRVEVVEKNGEKVVLDSYGDRYALNMGEGEIEEDVILQPGLVSNEGNISVDLRITDDMGRQDQKSLYINSTLVLPKSTQKIQIMANRNLRGDEVIRVAYKLPDGSTGTITRMGGIARIEETEEGGLPF